MIDFPELPSYHATAFHVTWSPVLGLDERITALIAVVGADGEVSVTQALPPSIVSLMARAESKCANELLGIIKQSLLAHLKRGQDVSSWTAPVSGFVASEATQYRGDDIDDITRQVGSLCSVFYRPA